MCWHSLKANVRMWGKERCTHVTGRGGVNILQPGESAFKQLQCCHNATRQSPCRPRWYLPAQEQYLRVQKHCQRLVGCRFLRTTWYDCKKQKQNNKKNIFIIFRCRPLAGNNCCNKSTELWKYFCSNVQSTTKIQILSMKSIISTTKIIFKYKYLEWSFYSSFVWYPHGQHVLWWCV